VLAVSVTHLLPTFDDDVPDWLTAVVVAVAVQLAWGVSFYREACRDDADY